MNKISHFYAINFILPCNKYTVFSLYFREVSHSLHDAVRGSEHELRGDERTPAEMLEAGIEHQRYLWGGGGFGSSKN